MWSVILFLHIILLEIQNGHPRFSKFVKINVEKFRNGRSAITKYNILYF
jgi:hypothetical protein